MGHDGGPTKRPPLEHDRGGRCRRPSRRSSALRPARWWLAIAASATLVSACQQEDEALPRFGSLQYESEHLEIWASDGLQACGGTYEYTEHWLAAFRERVGEHGDGSRHTFYWLSGDEFLPELCTTGIACAYPRSNVIYSTLIPAEHEIVHAELDAQPPSVLVEGAAEAFGTIASPFASKSMSIDPLLDEEQIPGIGYQTAGRFSRFIIEQHGIEAYFTLYESLDGATGREAFAEAVEDVLHVELPTLLQAFAARSPCAVGDWRYFDYECSTLPLTPWDSPTRWSDEIDLSCAADDVIGPRRGLVWTLRALEVEHPGSYDLVIDSTDESAQVAIFPCDSNCYDDENEPATPTTTLAAGGSASVFLTAGRHWMRVDHSDGSDAPVSVTLER